MAEEERSLKMEDEREKSEMIVLRQAKDEIEEASTKCKEFIVSIKSCREDIELRNKNLLKTKVACLCILYSL